MNDQLNGIVLSAKEYREHDMLLCVLSEEKGIVRFVARGVRKIKSKNASACLPFTFAQIQLNYQEQRSLQMLRTAEILKSFRFIREDLLKQSIASYFCECIEKSDFDDCVFPLLKESLDILESTTHPMRILCLFQAIMNRMHGIEPFVDGCVRCGRENGIYAISFKDGGFVCKPCYQLHADIQKSTLDLKCFRLLCRAQLQHYGVLKKYSDFTFSNFEDLYGYFQNYAGINVKSIRFLRSLMNLEEDLK